MYERNPIQNFPFLDDIISQSNFVLNNPQKGFLFRGSKGELLHRANSDSIIEKNKS